jgi:hypothetical protein
MQRLRAAHSLVALGAVSLLAGCGGSPAEAPSSKQPAPSVSGDQRGILATVDALQTYSREGDGRTVCGNLFTRQLVKSVEASAKRSCAREVRERLFTPDAEISVGRDIKVSDNRGTVVVREQNGNVSKLSLVEGNAQWRIDRITPQPKGTA